MTQTTDSRRSTLTAVLALAAVSVVLAGCGRKGALEPPPPREAASTAVVPAAPAP